MSSRRLRIIASATTTIALVGAAFVALSSPVQAAPTFDACAAPLPLASLTPADAGVRTVTGLTSVDSGPPVEFTGTYLGTLDNGIGDGLDMLVFDLEGPRITNPDGSVAAGSWSGISGSPVYDDLTGALVGSVSYGFTSALSARAGVTPASYIYDLASYSSSAKAAPDATIKASKSEASAIAKASSNPGPLGTGYPLQPAKQVSGVNATLANKIAKKSPLLQKKKSSLSGGFRAGGAGGGSAADYPIVPGGSIAMTSSTGTVTTGLVGTVTAVCGDKVYAFGHPAEFSGDSTQTFNGAQTVAIQEDGIMAPSFKIANIGRVKGTITQDRLQGVVGTLGLTASTATVSSSVTSPRLSGPRTSSTSVSQQASIPYVVASQLASDAVAVLNQYSSGDALMTWTIKYTRSGSAGVKTFKRSQRYSATQSFPDQVSYDAASDVEALLTNGFEKVTIASVSISSAMQPSYRAVKPTRVQYRQGGKWKYAGRNGIKAKPGSTTRVRLRVAAADPDSKAKTTFTSQTRFKVSKTARGKGRAVFTGQAFNYDDELVFGELLLSDLLGEGEDELEGPSSLNELLFFMSFAPRQDDVVSVLSYKNKRGKVATARTVRGPSVVDGKISVRFTFTK